MAFRILFVFIIIAAIPVEVLAQQVRHTSIFGWEEQTQHMIKNRYHNYGGIFYDRGLYRFTTPGMIREHSIQMMIYDFTSLDDYQWYYNREQSFRGFAGSYNLGEFLHGAVIRNYFPVSERIQIPIQFTRRYDIYSDRALLELGLDFEINEKHSVGLSHTLTEHKPDLDATFYYRFGNLPHGFVQVEFTPLDWANNAAYELSQRRGTFAPELRKYETKPYLFSVIASTPILNHFRGELAAGIQTQQQSIAESIPESDQFYRDIEKTRYLGLLIEYAIPYFTASINWKHRYADFSRSNIELTPEDPVDYGNYQIHNSLGLFLSVNYSNFFFDNWFWRNYNRDNQFDEFREEYRAGFQIYPFDFAENRIQMRNRIGFDPEERGFKWAIEWSADYRDFLRGRVDHPTHGVIYAFDYRENYRRLLTNRNERLTFFAGYRFSQQIYFELGASYNVDGDIYRGTYNEVRSDPTRFDGGFGRVMLYW